jgi:hypothetical protein
MTVANYTEDPSLGGITTPTRNNFFYGKLMGAFHFQTETAYQNLKRWTLNRLNMGFGVVCGLAVVPTNDGQHVQIAAGLGIDRFGREIIVPAASIPIDPRQPTDAWGKPAGNPIAAEGIVHLCLAYHECETDPVPVLVGDCGQEPTCAPSLIKERYRILVKEGKPPVPDLSCQFPNLFTPPPVGKSTSFHRQLSDRISQKCPEVSGDVSIPIAEINLPPTGTAITPDRINLQVRPLVYNQQLILEALFCLADQIGLDPTLTKVQEISWQHDREMAIDTFIAQGLTVTFSQAIQATTTLGRVWFIVVAEYPVGASRTDTTLPLGTIVTQRILDQEIKIEDNLAFFKPDPEFANTFSATLIAAGASLPILCRVILKSSFLTDADDLSRAVDGDFFGVDTSTPESSLKSGNGLPGGDFESWFFLTQSP